MSETPTETATKTRKYDAGTRIFAIITLAIAMTGALLGVTMWQAATSAPQQAVALCFAMALAVVPYVVMRSLEHLS